MNTRILGFLLVWFLAFAPLGCSIIRKHNVNVVPVGASASRRADEARDDAQSKAAASVIAATVANEQNPPGPPQEATAAELSIAQAALPAPTAEDVAAALARTNAALAGDLDSARAAWKAAQSEAEQLRSRVAALEAAAEREKIKNEAEILKLQRALKDSEDAAFNAQRRMINWICIGGSALLFVGGIGCFTFLSSIPWLGPRIGLALLASGAGLIVFGVVANWILSHPIWASVIVGAPLLFAVGLAVSNHFHDKRPTP